MRALLILLLLLLPGSCQLQPAYREAAEAETLDDVTNGLTDTAARMAEDEAVEAKEKAAGWSADRMLVSRGEVAVEVARTDEAIARFLASVREWGGYLAHQQDTAVTVRLPADRFETAFAELRTYGRVLSESRTAEDVTEEFVDLGIRLDNARKARDRLIALLEKADKVEDVLKIEEQLRRLTEEIERMEGRRKFLADQVAMATLTARFQALTAAGQPVRLRQPSRFSWINQVGVERVLLDF